MATRWAITVSATFLTFSALAGAVSEPASPYPSHPGLTFLLTKAYLPADFDQEVFDEIWTSWEEPLRSKAAKATPAERRAMAFDRYGLDDVPGRQTPLQYTLDSKGGWVMNCLACHGGKVGGKLIPGAPNTHLALQTLIDDVRATKVRLKKKLTHMDIGSTFIPLGKSNGTTNAVIFGVALGSHRDEDLNVRPDKPLQRLVHHDHDAPPWWNVKRKNYIYSDGFAPKDHRALMQFLLVHQNGPEKFREWEDDYKQILAWIESLEAPKYPFTIDEPLALKGQVVFNRACADCHGAYGPGGSYPGKNIPLDVVGTDPVRLKALPVHMREGYSRNWLAFYGQKKVITDPKGYIAPPLDGIWASAPYFHNGSAPTLWHVMHPEKRPIVWKRTRDGYDAKRVGLEVVEMEQMPKDVIRANARREYFDSRIVGKSVEGHLFPDELTDDEKIAVIEYLKTL